MRKLVCAVMSMFAILAFTATAQASGGDSGKDHGTCHYYSDKHDDDCCDDHGSWRDDDKNKCCDDHGDWSDHDKGDCDDCREDDHGDHHNGDYDKGHSGNDDDDDNCGDDNKRDSERYALH